MVLLCTCLTVCLLALILLCLALTHMHDPVMMIITFVSPSSPFSFIILPFLSCCTGYGDIELGRELRWFQIFYLIVSTYCVGNAIAGMTTIGEKLSDARRQFAWRKRSVSLGMMAEMQSDGDDRIDQFEFAMSSLLALGKVTSSDLEPIMEQYKKLADENLGYIVLSDAMAAAAATEDDGDIDECRPRDEETSDSGTKQNDGNDAADENMGRGRKE